MYDRTEYGTVQYVQYYVCTVHTQLNRADDTNSNAITGTVCSMYSKGQDVRCRVVVHRQKEVRTHSMYCSNSNETAYCLCRYTV